MKKITTLLILLPFFMMAQINIDNEWKKSINPVFENLDKSKIPSGMLLDYAMEFTDVTAYNGVLTDTTFIDINVMGDIYKTLFMAKVVADTVSTPLYNRYAYNWAKARYNATKNTRGAKSVYVLAGLLYEYQSFNENALAQNKITVTNNKYYDKYNGGVWQNPYQTQTTFALTTPLKHSRSKDVVFKLPRELFLSNLKDKIASVQIDVDNGQGYQNLPFDSEVSLQFSENKIHNITYKLTLTNNQILYCRSKFKIDDPSLERGAVVVNNERVYIYEGNNFFSGAWLTIRHIPGATQITRPFIISEGLDTGNFTAPEDFGGERTMQDFLVDLNTSGGNLRALIDAGDFNNSYDLIYIDWNRGMADMRDNSRVLEEVIKWVNAQKVISGSTEPNVLLGQSMGGVIGRYTLARMEKERKTHDVRLFIAHDSPMQGANTPLALQHFSIHMRQEYSSTPLAWITGEVLVPIGLGLGQLGSDFLNFFGANTGGIPAYVTPTQLLSLQDQTASRQLNYWSATEAPFNNQDQTQNYNIAWQQTLTNMGWPILSRNVAISNGNECAVDNDFIPGAPSLIIDSRSNPGFWLDMLNGIMAPLVGVATQDLGLIIIGSLPGRSRWQTNFDFNSYGIQGSQNRIYRGRIRFEKKLLWIGPTITHNLINKSFNAPNTALPFDTFSGGIVDLRDFANSLPGFLPTINFVNPRYGFIPVVSALDIKRNNGQVNPTDYLNKYAGGLMPVPALTSGFNNFIVDFNNGNPRNNEHISFQARNGNWLAQELQANTNTPVYPSYNCSFICENVEILGNKTICTSETFTVPAGAPSYTWTISGSGATITSSSNTATVTRTGQYNGSIIVRVVINGGDCGTVTLNKNVWLGVPKFNSLQPVGNQTGFNPNQENYIANEDGSIACNAISMKVSFDADAILEYQWEKITTDVNWSVNASSGTINMVPLCNKDFYFKVRARNSCGWSDWKSLDFYMSRCNVECSTIPPSNGVVGDNFILSPNPVTNTDLLDIAIKSTSPWFYPPGTIDPITGMPIPAPLVIQKVNIKIYSSAGTFLQSYNNKFVPAQIDISNLTQGSYLVIFEHYGKIENYTIIKG